MCGPPRLLLPSEEILMFLTKRISDEIRAMFPGVENEGLRLEIRACYREGKEILALAGKFPFSTSQFRALQEMAASCKRWSGA